MYYQLRLMQVFVKTGPQDIMSLPKLWYGESRLFSDMMMLCFTYLPYSHSTPAHADFSNGYFQKCSFSSVHHQKNSTLKKLSNSHSSSLSRSVRFISQLQQLYSTVDARDLGYIS